MKITIVRASPGVLAALQLLAEEAKLTLALDVIEFPDALLDVSLTTSMKPGSSDHASASSVSTPRHVKAPYEQKYAGCGIALGGKPAKGRVRLEAWQATAAHLHRLGKKVVPRAEVTKVLKNYAWQDGKTRHDPSAIISQLLDRRYLIPIYDDPYAKTETLK